MSKYTFFTFCSDVINTCKSVFSGDFLQAKDKFLNISSKIIDYTYFKSMNYIVTKYNSGDYRISDYDYLNKNYTPVREKQPYIDIKIGSRPDSYSDFYFDMFKLVWLDIFKYVELNPIPCLMILLLYAYFPFLFFIFECFLSLYLVYNLFDK